VADQQRYLCLDVGTRRIGVAVSDLLGMTAQPVGVIQCTKEETDLAAVLDWVRQYAPARLVCGLPRNMDGRESEQAQYTRDFVAKLQSAGLQIPVVFWDERLTTAAASRVLLEADMRRSKRKQVVDKIAACFILQSYLDAGTPAKGM